MRLLKEDILPFENDTDLNDKLFKEAAKQIAASVKVDKTYDIPYLAGISKDRKTVYIDRHFPLDMPIKDTTINIEEPICLHELVEPDMEYGYDLAYQLGHQVALTLELRLVECMGIDVNEYNKYCDKYVKKAGDERLTNVPKDLDLKPYYDEEDYTELQKIMKSEE